jgi:hypothetical protein
MSTPSVQLPEQSPSGQTLVPMFDPQGTVRSIPTTQVNAAKQAGGKLAFKMTDPQGTPRWIPHDQLDAAVKAGGKLIPVGSQSSQQVVQQETGIHPFENHGAQAAAGPARSLWNAIRSPYDLAKAAAAELGNSSETAVQAGGGTLGLILDRMMVQPAIQAHETGKDFRTAASNVRSIARRITAASGSAADLKTLQKQYPQYDLSTPEKAQQVASSLNRTAIGLFVKSLPAELGALPVIGPMGQQAGERMAAGDVAGAVTESATNAVLLGAPSLTKAAVGKVADAAKAPVHEVADAIATKFGPRTTELAGEQVPSLVGEAEPGSKAGRMQTLLKRTGQKAQKFEAAQEAQQARVKNVIRNTAAETKCRPAA